MCAKDRPLQTLVEQGDYWIVNWRLVRYFKSYDEAIMLGYLSSMQKLFGNQQGIFYRTISSVKADTLLDGRRQRKAINNLKKYGFIEMESKGMPKKRYFRVKPEAIINVLNELRYSEQYSIE